MQSVVVLLLLLYIASLAAASLSNSMTIASDTKGERPRAIHIMAVVPTAGELDNINALPQWKRGEEILLGARLALREINNSFNLFTGYQLEVIPIRVPLCNFNTGIIPFIKELTSDENNIAGIVGYFCHNLAQRLSQLVQHEQIRVVQISATSSLDRNCVPHVQHSILPSTEFSARAVVLLMQRLGWSRVAIISNQNLNFMNAKRAFFKDAKGHGIKVELNVELSPMSYRSSTKQLLQDLLNFGIKIIIAFVSPSEAVDIICYAYLDGFKWPDYAWIIMEVYDSKSFLYSKFCSQTSAIVSLSNVIFLSPQQKKPHEYSALKESAKELKAALQSNPYANVLYDSVWAIALTLNGSLSKLKARNISVANISCAKREFMDVLEEQLSELSFVGATGLLNFSHSAAALQISVDLLQFQDGQPIKIGSYDLSFDKFLLNKSVLGEIPSDTLNRIYVLYPIPLMVILSIVIGLCFALTTISMCLFIYYRQQPAIKATSNTLSHCMFIGCYFLLISSFFHTVTSGNRSNESLQYFSCSFISYSGTIGFDIVLATVIAKTLRIYHIFNRFGNVDPPKICYDQGLFILILIIVSVKIVLLILWTFLDINHVVEMEEFISQSVPPYFLVRETCQSNHLRVWIVAVFGYSIILMFIMVLLAVLTRKVKQSDFKDSKKINTLVVTLAFNICISVTLWILLRLIDATNLSRVAYGIGTMTAAELCQVFLILPKILPLVLHSCCKYLRCRKLELGLLL